MKCSRNICAFVVVRFEIRNFVKRVPPKTLSNNVDEPPKYRGGGGGNETRVVKLTF